MRRVLEYDTETGTTIWHDYDHATKTTTLYEEQDVAPYLDRNSRLMAAADKSAQIRDAWWHVANIPNTLIARWRLEGLDVFNKSQAKDVARRLNSREYSRLRTSPGNV